MIKFGNVMVRPNEIMSLKYWFHLFIIVLIVGVLINIFVQPMPIDFRFLGFGVLFLGISDIIAHTILHLN